MTSVAIIHNHPIHYKHLLFCALGRCGVDFEVLFTAGSSSNRIEVPLPDKEQYRYSIGYPGPYEGARMLPTAQFVWSALNRLRPEVLIISGYYDVAAWSGWLWAERNGVGRILWAESNEFDHKRHQYREILKRLFIKRCDYAHVYGHSNREYLKRLGMAEDKIFIKRAVADTDLLLKAPVPPSKKRDRITLLYCGRYSPEKNLPMLFRAFAKASQSVGNAGLVLKLVGYGPLESDLRKLAQVLGVNDCVEFAGKASHTELPQIYRSADAFILPSTSEPWGLVVNEAMLSGLPVAVSNQCGCAADLVTPETGWTFSPYDETELIGLLTKIALTPRVELERMGSAARVLGSEYSAENCAAVVVQTVDRILRDPSITNDSIPMPDQPQG